jgi:hypothetical protein
MPSKARAAVVIAGLAIAAALVLAYTLVRPRVPVQGSAADAATGAAAPVVEIAAVTGSPHVLFRHAAVDARYNHLAAAPLEAPGARRGFAPLQCERVAFAGGRGICLEASRGVLTRYTATIFDARLQPLHSLKLDGSPSRARVAPDGRLGAITVFVTGQEHGYASASFSTKTTIVDLGSGAALGELEQFTTTRDGRVFRAADFNFWGVTFARDGTTFYASLQTAGRIYLVRGDLRGRAMTIVHENVECPALSPDNRRIAFKRRVGGGLAPWRFYVLDLETMAERPLEAETRSIDDQIEWLDDSRVLYGAYRSSQSAIKDVWVAPVGGGGPAREFLSGAESPAVVR